MKYNAPPGSINPNAPYITGRPGIQKGSAVPAEAIEYPQREIVNIIQTAGIEPTNENLGQLAMAVQAMIDKSLAEKEMQRYELCEFYTFRHPILRPGFQPATGGLIEQAVTRYPEAWAYLQSEEGKFLCKTEAEWQAMTQETWHTLADGTEIGWEGIGGAPFFAPDYETGALRLPDVRGMYAEAAGFDGLNVGAVHGDASRNVEGTLAASYTQYPGSYSPSGAFSLIRYTSNNMDGGGAVTTHRIYNFDSSVVVPTANKNQPRAWGAHVCVYLGLPAA